VLALLLPPGLVSSIIYFTRTGTQDQQSSNRLTEKVKRKSKTGLGFVAHGYNPSYSGGKEA
jgi:hypothetical protein